jgi:hypothetical protein
LKEIVWPDEVKHGRRREEEFSSGRFATEKDDGGHDRTGAVSGRKPVEPISR